MNFNHSFTFQNAFHDCTIVADVELVMTLVCGWVLDLFTQCERACRFPKKKTKKTLKSRCLLYEVAMRLNILIFRINLKSKLLNEN